MPGEGKDVLRTLRFAGIRQCIFAEERAAPAHSIGKLDELEGKVVALDQAVSASAMAGAASQAALSDRIRSSAIPGRPMMDGWHKRYTRRMEFDQLLVRFFGTQDIAPWSPDQLSRNIEQLNLQFGLKKDAGRRFAL